jgi:tRNA(His) 5'-end guanylyltransferase
MKNDDFGDRMKSYELETQRQITVPEGETHYPYLRLDGRSFSKFTRKMVSADILEKPRDATFESVFLEATRDTVKEFSFLLGFHQSDEISFHLKPITSDTVQNMLFGGRLDKILSVVPAFFTNRFTVHFQAVYGFAPQCSFDCRYVQFPNYAEATNMLVWRFQDATRNVIQDYAHHVFGHKALDKLSTQEKLERLLAVYMEFDEDVLKGYGNFVQRELFEMLYKPEYGDNNFEGTVTRSRISKIDVDFRNLNFDERVKLIYGQDFELVEPTGFFATLTDEQKAAALAYRGEETHGDRYDKVFDGWKEDWK